MKVFTAFMRDSQLQERAKKIALAATTLLRGGWTGLKASSRQRSLRPKRRRVHLRWRFRLQGSPSTWRRL